MHIFQQIRREKSICEVVTSTEGSKTEYRMKQSPLFAATVTYHFTPNNGAPLKLNNNLQCLNASA
jgi:hypothetical protein